MIKALEPIYKLYERVKRHYDPVVIVEETGQWEVDRLLLDNVVLGLGKDVDSYC